MYSFFPQKNKKSSRKSKIILEYRLEYTIFFMKTNNMQIMSFKIKYLCYVF